MSPDAVGVIDLLQSHLADLLEIPVDQIETDVPLTAFGVDSQTGIQLVTLIESFSGRKVDASLLEARPTLAELAQAAVCVAGRAPEGQPSSPFGPPPLLPCQRPAGFPAPGEATAYRAFLTRIADGVAPPQDYVTRFGLPVVLHWSYGQVFTNFTTEPELQVAPGVIFGGFTASLVDQAAGLATYSVIPDRLVVKTRWLHIDFKGPLRLDEYQVCAQVTALSPDAADCRVMVRGLDGRTVAVAEAQEALVR